MHKLIVIDSHHRHVDFFLFELKKIEIGVEQFYTQENSGFRSDTRVKGSKIKINRLQLELVIVDVKSYTVALTCLAAADEKKRQLKSCTTATLTALSL